MNNQTGGRNYAPPLLKKLNRTISALTLFLMLFSNFAFLQVGSVIAAGLSVSTNPDSSVKVNPANGFPMWYEDASGTRLQPCLGTNLDGSGPADANCVLLADARYNPANNISFPDNFPEEFFYYIADSVPVSVGTIAGEEARFRIALEGSFAGGVPAVGDQMTFLRINLAEMNGLKPSSEYTVTYPFGTFIFHTDATGRTTGEGNAGGGLKAFRNEDPALGAAAGAFSDLLPADTTKISNFLSAISPVAPNGYLGNPNMTQAIGTGAGATIAIDGPDIGGTNVNHVETNLWNVAGKLAIPVLASINVSPTNISVQSGSTQQFSAATLDQFNDPIVSANATSWASSNPEIGTIDAVTGIFTAVSAGTTTITATNGTVSGSAIVTVTSAAPIISSLVIAPTNHSMPYGQSQPFSATALDQFGNQLVNAPAVTWMSGNDAIGTIDAVTGLFTALASGSTLITASSGAVTASTNITVHAPTDARLRVSLNQDGTVRTDPANGFPLWYGDDTGLRLQQCLAGPDGLADPKCVLLGDATYNPANQINFPTNFPGEFFYYIAESDTLRVGPDLGGSAKLRMALEGSFANVNGAPAAGDQTTFIRINLPKVTKLEPNSTYTVSYPFGTFTFETDGTGDGIKAGNAGGNVTFRNQDPVVAAGGGFTALLPVDSTNISKLLKAVSPASLAGYIGDPVARQTIDTGTTGAIFAIDGPNAGGAGNNHIETNLWNVAGKIMTNTAPVIAPIADQAASAGNPHSFTVVATDAEADPITYSVAAVSSIGNETAAVINPASGVFSWTPTTAGISTFTVNASDGSVTTSATVSIAVDYIPVLTTINVTPAAPSIAVGAQPIQLTVSGLDQAGAAIVPTPIYNFTSSNSSIVTVDGTGLVTAVAPGTAVITVDAGTLVTGSVTVTVPDPAAIALANATTAVILAETSNLQADVNAAQLLVTNLPDGAEKTALQTRINAVQAVIDAAAAQAAADLAAATLVANQIAALPVPITLADKPAVVSARANYDALTAAQKLLVTNLTSLADAELGIATLEAAAAQAAADQAAATVVINQIAALPQLVTLTLADGNLVSAARAAYDILTAIRQALVTNIATLVAAEDQIAALQAAADQAAALANATTAVILAETSNLQADVNAAQLLVTNLSDGAEKTALQTRIYAVQAVIDAAAAQAAADQAAATSVMNQITALPVPITLADKPAVVSARTNYDALTAAQKLLVTNLTLLTDAESTISSLEAAAAQAAIDQAAATSVMNQIAALPTPITLTDKSAVVSARTNYNTLTAAQQLLVSNFTLLTDAESTITSLEAAAAQAAAEQAATEAVVLAETSHLQADVDAAELLVAALPIGAVKTDLQARIETVQAIIDAAIQAAIDQAAATLVANQIAALPVPITLADKPAVVSARAAHETLTEAQKLLVINLSILTDAESTVATLEAAAAEQAATEAVVLAETSHLQADVDAAQPLITALSDAAFRADLQARLDAVQAIINDHIAPDIFVSYSPESLISNHDYTFTLSTNDLTAELEYRLDGGEWTKYEGKVTVSTEGSHTFIGKASDKADNDSTTETIAFTIDKTKPEITIGEYITAPTNQNVVVTATTNEGSLEKGSNIFTQNGSYVFTATDDAGNTATKTVTISNIDKVKPVISIAGHNTAPTNKDVTVTASTDEGELNSASYTFTQNGSYDFVAADAAGNISTTTVVINNIDKVKPSISLKGEESIEILAGETFTDPGTTTTDDSDAAVSGKMTVNGSVDANQPGTYTIAYDVTDAAGNKADRKTRTVKVNTRGSGGGGGAPISPIVTSINVPLTVSHEQGGTVTDDHGGEGKITIKVPAKTVETKTTFTTRIETLAEGEKPSETAGAFMVGNKTFIVNATDTNGSQVRTFSNQLVITLNLALPDDTSDLGVYYYNETASEWQQVPGAAFDPAAGKVTFMVDHLTKFAVIKTAKSSPSITPKKLDKKITIAEPTKTVDGAKKILGVKLFSEGTLVRDANKRIFVIKNQFRRLISSLTELKKFAGKKIIEATDQELAKHPEAVGAKQFKDGQLIRGADKKVFVIKNGEKQPIKTLNELKKFRGKKINEVSEMELAKY